MPSHHNRENSRETSAAANTEVDGKVTTEVNTEDISKMTKLSREEISKKIKRDNPGSIPVILVPHGFKIQNTKIILERERMLFFLASWIYKNNGDIVYFAVDGAILRRYERIGHLYDRSASSDGYLTLHVYKESPFG